MRDKESKHGGDDVTFIIDRAGLENTSLSPLAKNKHQVPGRNVASGRQGKLIHRKAAHSQERNEVSMEFR